MRNFKNKIWKLNIYHEKMSILLSQYKWHYHSCLFFLIIKNRKLKQSITKMEILTSFYLNRIYLWSYFPSCLFPMHILTCIILMYHKMDAGEFESWFSHYVISHFPMSLNIFSKPNFLNLCNNTSYRCVYIYLFDCLSLRYSTWDLVPWLGVEPGPPALEVQTLSHWTIREISMCHNLCYNFLSLFRWLIIFQYHENTTTNKLCTSLVIF